MVILRRCREAAEDIRRLKERIAQRREVLGSLSAPQMDPNGGGHGSPDRDKYGKIYGDIDQLEREQQRRREAENVEKMSALALLEMIPDLESRILYDYYVQRMTTPEIASSRKYQVSYVRKKKRDAERLMDMLSEERVNSTLPPWYLKEKGDAT